MDEENQTPYDPGVPSGPDLPGTEKMSLNKKLLIIGLIALLIAVAGTIVFLILNGKGDVATESTDGSSFVTFIPIWVAVFVPFLARRKKELPQKKEKIKLAIIVSLTAALVIGTIILWLILR
ncbi:hypothetical protein GWN26_03055 [Candidatus Saccharibacteria bacterium]|nr:hypothetical protein [Candidatus Saccharibacteria bacterium]NIV03359.1 hypothetical protein [Calditrichia bacterium]NIS37905.1 hypothetical protein [Candidatus Saccharibacteria bacterium]NIV71568.1 hypothetical protein [Calditrichia bacterium]NIV98170.1 hypothetical protein [Candidatus Saccharibacteria bacterium]